MDKEIARLRPANASRVTLPPDRSVMVVSGINKAEVIGKLQYLARQGGIKRQYEDLGTHGGLYRVRVELQPPAKPWWAKVRGRHVAILLGASASVALLAWGLASLVLALVAALPYLLGTLIVVMLLGLAFRGPAIEVVQRVTIRR